MLFQHGGVRHQRFLHTQCMILTLLAAIDLTTLVSNLDNTASDIVAYQRDSTVQRKELAQKTKEFRKLDDTTKLTEIKGLLKCTIDTPHDGTILIRCSLPNLY